MPRTLLNYISNKISDGLEVGRLGYADRAFVLRTEPCGLGPVGLQSADAVGVKAATQTRLRRGERHQAAQRPSGIHRTSPQSHYRTAVK